MKCAKRDCKTKEEKRAHLFHSSWQGYDTCCKRWLCAQWLISVCFQCPPGSQQEAEWSRIYILCKDTWMTRDLIFVFKVNCAFWFGYLEICRIGFYLLQSLKLMKITVCTWITLLKPSSLSKIINCSIALTCLRKSSRDYSCCPFLTFDISGVDCCAVWQSGCLFCTGSPSPWRGGEGDVSSGKFA